MATNNNRSVNMKLIEIVPGVSKLMFENFDRRIGT